MLVSLRAATDGLAHDLKTPITRIKARIELAIMRDSLADPVLFMETVQDLDALLKLINDLFGRCLQARGSGVCCDRGGDPV